MARVQRILDATDADIVISSTWRLSHNIPRLRDLLSDHGLLVKSSVIGRTPDRSCQPAGSLVWQGSERGLEIQAWIDDNGGRGRAHIHGGWSRPICILDDDDDMAHLAPWLVQTDFEHGLTDAHVVRAIAMLRGEPAPLGLNEVSR